MEVTEFEKRYKEKGHNGFIETKRFNIEIKADTDEFMDQGIFEGIANAFNNIDYADDVSVQGSFKKTLKESKRRALFFLHNMDVANLIGGVKDMKEIEDGLFVKGQIDMDDPQGKKVHKLIKQKYIDRMSIGFKVVQATWEKVKVKGAERMIRYIKEYKLMEVSLIPVSMAMNPDSLITSVKSSDEIYDFIIANRDNIELKNKIISLLGYEPEDLKSTHTESDTKPAVIDYGSLENIDKTLQILKEVKTNETR